MLHKWAQTCRHKAPPPWVNFNKIKWTFVSSNVIKLRLLQPVLAFGVKTMRRSPPRTTSSDSARQNCRVRTKKNSVVAAGSAFRSIVSPGLILIHQVWDGADCQDAAGLGSAQILQLWPVCCWTQSRISCLGQNRLSVQASSLHPQETWCCLLDPPELP